MFKAVDLSPLRRDSRIAFYFRYPLYHSDFQELRENGRLLGRIAAKPLFGRLTKAGKVDRSKGYNGDIAAIFIPARARTVRSARLILTHIPARSVTTAEGKRNWPAIHAAAEKAVRRELAKK